jgi:hypothetical protein
LSTEQFIVVRGWAICFALLVASGNAALPARANDGIQLRFRTPEGCPDREYLISAIDRFLPSDKRSDGTAEVDVEIAARVDGEYSLRIEWASAGVRGDRQLYAESCRAATDTAAWLIAVALKRPEAATQASEPDPDGLRFEPGMGAIADFSVLPGPGWAATARLGIATGGFHIDLSGSYFPAKNTQSGPIRAELELFEVGVRGCYLVAYPNVAIGPCLRAALGRMAASSVSVPPPTSGHARFQALGASVEARVRLVDQLWLISDAGLIWNQRRPLFMVSGGAVLHQPRTVGLRLGLGLILTLR